MAEPVVVFFNAILPSSLQQDLSAKLASLNGLKLIFRTDDEQFDEQEAVRRAHVIVGWRIDPELLEVARNLRLYIFAGVGVQSVLKALAPIADRQQLTVLKCTANTYATAQHAVSLLLAVTNKIVLHDLWMRAGRWRTGDKEAASVTLRSRKVGLLGYGAVNQKVERFLGGFTLSFNILKRTWPDSQFKMKVRPPGKYSPENLNEFLDDIDILFIGLPLTDDTQGMIGSEQLELLGPRGILVNVSRGGIVEQKALYHALRNDVIAGAGLDVWYDYRPEPDRRGRKFPYDAAYPFHELENVVLSPHRGASPVFDPQRWDEVVSHIRRYVQGEKLHNVVDFDRGY
jgi:phosphoglycerate dehydrogenase-like enzyme